jgi:hypothetical protein
MDAERVPDVPLSLPPPRKLPAGASTASAPVATTETRRMCYKNRTTLICYRQQNMSLRGRRMDNARYGSQMSRPLRAE